MEGSAPSGPDATNSRSTTSQLDVSTHWSTLAAELVALIHAQCRQRGITLEQFSDAVGWDLKTIIDLPERLLADITIDGLKWICRELGNPWDRVILGL
ncbi:MAG TPA: hypothetical protein VG733_12485 [Chthoniobacteraceae bacterium]|nr:hypothetical protein [Chthoniobacteraceae bacterium]